MVYAGEIFPELTLRQGITCTHVGFYSKLKFAFDTVAFKTVLDSSYTNAEATCVADHILWRLGS